MRIVHPIESKLELEQIHVRSCTPEDLDAALRLKRLWEQEGASPTE